MRDRRDLEQKYRKQDLDEFDRKMRRFRESLAHKERRMLREIIATSIEEADIDDEGEQ